MNNLNKKRTISLLTVVFILIIGLPHSHARYPSPDKFNKTKIDEKRVVLDVLDLKNMDILDVLKLISQKSGINIVAGQNVKGRVTVYLKDMVAEDALQVIVDAYGWAYAKENGIIKVMTVADYESKYGGKYGKSTKTQIIQLLFASTADLVPILDQVKGPNGKVISDDKTGTLILMDEPEKLIEMGQIISRIDVPIQTKVFQLHYAKADSLSSKVTEVLTPNVGKMRFDERSNKIIVSDTELKISEVENLIKEFDNKDSEVLIEAKIINITLDDEHQMGVNWEAIVSNFHNLNLSSNMNTFAEGATKGTLSVGTIADDNYSFLIEALDTVGVSNILASPRIAAINNEEAKILIGSTEPYVTTTTTTPSSGPVTTAETVNFIEVGTKLFVTPTIHPDGFITMKIKPEVSQVIRFVETTNSDIPVVGTSEAETTVLVKDGVTIVIGGLIEDEHRKNVSKVPVLGNVPFLGTIFRKDSETVQKQEIVIFLTPRIITGDIPTREKITSYDEMNQKFDFYYE